MGSIYAKIALVQSKLFVPKENKNTFGGYNYRSCEDILVRVKPLLEEQGLVLMLMDNIESVNGWNYIKATAMLADTETGETFSCNGWAREADKKSGMDVSQITGTASSYARKYALNGLFAIDNTKDADTEDYYKRTHKEEAPTEEPKPVESVKPTSAPYTTAELEAAKKQISLCKTTTEVTATMAVHSKKAYYPELRKYAGKIFKNLETKEKAGIK